MRHSQSASCNDVPLDQGTDEEAQTGVCLFSCPHARARVGLVQSVQRSCAIIN
jgi:hypothetical protein